MAQKAILKLDVHDDKEKQKVMALTARFTGLDSIAINMKDGKLTVTGYFDAIQLVEKLRKSFSTQLESVGPAKDDKKGSDSSKKGDDNTKNSKDQKGFQLFPDPPRVYPIPLYYPPQYQYQTYVPRPAYFPDYRSVEEEPNWCVIM